MDGSAVRGELRRYLAETPSDVAVVYLYGSVARGEDGPSSDVDLAVLFDPPPPPELGALPQRMESELERRLGRPVEVLVLNEAPADLVHRVLRDGQLLLERNRGLRIRFEVDRRNEYFDLQPILDRYRAGAAP